jgi:hypothetical protein
MNILLHLWAKAFLVSSNILHSCLEVVVMTSVLFFIGSESDRPSQRLQGTASVISKTLYHGLASDYITSAINILPVMWPHRIVGIIKWFS